MKIKRLFLLGLTAVFAAACVQEQAENPQAALPGGEVIEAGTAPATKTYADVPDVLWAEGDCITAYMGTNAKGTYKLTEGAGTTYGKFKLKVAPGTQPGKKVRLKGKGGVKSDGTLKDLIIVFDVTIPANLSDHQKSLIEQARRS